MTDRRGFLATALGTAGAALLPSTSQAQEGFTLEKLPYAFDALEPHIDAKTMEIHWGRHHKAYVDNLNKALAGNQALASKSIEKLLIDVNSVPGTIRGAVINNGIGGHFVLVSAAAGGLHRCRHARSAGAADGRHRSRDNLPNLVMVFFVAAKIT